MKKTRIAILGPESSGKTTLAEALANRLNANLSEEFARSYLNERGGGYEKPDLDIIAKQQFESNQRTTNGKHLIADTEMLTIKIWSEVKYGNTSKAINRLLGQQTFDLYLLCKPDIPWEEDPLREHPQYRNELFEMYKNELDKLQYPYIVIAGQNRLDKALEVII